METLKRTGNTRENIGEDNDGTFQELVECVAANVALALRLNCGLCTQAALLRGLSLFFATFSHAVPIPSTS